MRVLLPLVLLGLLSSPAGLAAQTLSELLQSIRTGGGWIEVPIEDGRGSILTSTLPTGGLSVSGCLQVWGGHSGRWEIEARDTRGPGRLDVEAAPGEAVPFAYTPGLRTQLDVQFRWSEPRDTTLLLWVGLDGPARRERDACEPVYGSGG